VTLASGASVVGVRLRPGVAGAVLGMPASALCDCTADAAEVLGYEVTAPLLEALAAGVDPHALLLRAVQERGVRTPDPLVSAAVEALGRPQARVSAVFRRAGGECASVATPRHRCRRVWAEAACARPALSAAAGACPATLLELALEAGYADQAHMTAEVGLLAGLSPVRFLKDRSPTAA